jgi:hypothetical protein
MGESIIIWELKNRWLIKCCLCGKPVFVNEENVKYYPYQQWCNECNPNGEYYKSKEN